MARIVFGGRTVDAAGSLADALRPRRHEVRIAESLDDAVRIVRAERSDVVLLDLDAAGDTAPGALQRLRREAPGTAVVVLTADEDVGPAVAAMKLGAVDFLPRPGDTARAVETIEAILALRRGATGTFRLHVLGAARPFLVAKDLALRFAVPDVNVLLTGETGTGKDVFARMIHDASKRSQGPFVPVDCSVLPGELIESELFGHEKGAFTGATAARLGRFESAQGGTLFLDEIGNLPLGVQAKLLRVLQERRFSRVGSTETVRLDVRLVSAANVDLEEAIRRGAFRRDLFFRLNEMTIALPPLRERPGDIALLARHFVDAAARRMGKPAPALADDALRRLEACDWPGNVRELENAMKAAVVLAEETIEVPHLPPSLRAGVRDAVADPNRGHEPAAGVRNQPRPEGRGSVPESASLVSGSGVPRSRVSRSPGAAADAPEVLHVELDIPLAETGIDLKAVGSRAAEEAERALLRELLARGEPSLGRLSRLLDVDPKTLRAKLKKYGLREG
ncbi:MAG: sigma-54-dependent Fis family transcriptional regulator [Deltaproteobacteria bacterium]|nr:sigma-54-dependent Fis family transcriptional regulator [Deltaproteobacteria bacterium]